MHSLSGLMLRLLCVCVLALCGLAGGASSARAENLIASFDIFEDGSGRMPFESVRSRNFTPADTTLAKGYTKSAYWVRIRVLPSATSHHVVLSVQPVSYDSIVLYRSDLSQTGTWAQHRLGALASEEDGEWASSLMGFMLTPAPGGTVYYVRLSTTGSMNAKFTVLPQFEAYRARLKTDLFQIVYLAVMAVLMLWAFRQRAVTHAPLFGRCALLQVLWLLHNFLWFGYGKLVLPDGIETAAYQTFRSLVIIVTAQGVLFHKSVLIRFAPRRYALVLVDLLLAVSVSSFFMFWLFDRNYALGANALVIVLAPLVLLLNALTARRDASPGLFLMRIAYSILAMTTLTWSLSLFGIMQQGASAEFGASIHGATTGLIVFMMLHAHGKNLIARAQAATEDLVAIRQRRAVEAESNRMLMALFDMLTHETKNALSVINLSVSGEKLTGRQRARIASAIRDLTAVIDRCSQTTRLDTNEQIARPAACDIAAILRDCCETSPVAARITLDAPHESQALSDPVLLRIIFTNLIENAEKYSSPATGIAVMMTRYAPDQLSITVENEAGPFGFPDETRVFQKYYRNARAASQIGSGLGLYLVQGLVGILGGHIHYRRLGSHARFTVVLPC